MSKLQELIQELCPEGVEFKKLGEISSFRRGSFPQPYGNKEWYGGEGAMPFIQVADIEDNMQLAKKTKRLISRLAQPMSVFAPKGSIIISLQGSIGRIAVTQYDAYIDRTVAIFTNISKNVVHKYFVYQLQSIFKIKEKTARGSTIKTITKEEFTNFEIPLPPLEVQNEIVRILDAFTSHAVELQAELQARKEQYEYYRNKLLTFDENDERVKWMTLGDVCFYPKQRISVSLLHKNNYVGVDNLLPNKQGKKESNCVPSEGNCLSYTINDILIGNIRPYLKKIWISNNNGGTNGDVLTYRIREEFLNCVMPKYLYYILSSDDFFDFDNQYAKGAKMPRGDKNMNMKYSIPIPPLSEQQRIVSILDKFESLVNDLSEGLPAEIAAVQEQYEYYRNKLLTFKRKS